MGMGLEAHAAHEPRDNEKNGHKSIGQAAELFAHGLMGSWAHGLTGSRAHGLMKPCPELWTLSPEPRPFPSQYCTLVLEMGRYARLGAWVKGTKVQTVMMAVPYCTVAIMR